MPLVSVLLPTFSRNSSGHLRNAIMSVLEQGVGDFELFVVDDGSTDGSAETIREIAARDNRVRHLRFEENVGLPALTCAEAFRQSKGDFIAWQFDDCTWKPDLLSSLIEEARKKPQVGLIYGQTQMNSGTSTDVLGEAFSKEALLTKNFIPNCATLIRRDVFLKAGWFDPSVVLKRICDYDMWVRASEHFEFAFLEKILAVENGLSLPDSLGNSVTLVSSLATRYRQNDRSAYLQIENMENWVPYAVSDWMNEAEKEEFAQILFEHLLRIKKYSRAMSAVYQIIPHKFDNATPLESPASSLQISQDIFLWYIARLSQARQKREAEAGDYIKKQRKYIEDQHAYIERQHKMIHDLEGAIAPQNPSRWSALKRAFKLD